MENVKETEIYMPDYKHLNELSEKTERLLNNLLFEIKADLADQATNTKLSALAHRRRVLKLHNKIDKFYKKNKIYY